MDVLIEKLNCIPVITVHQSKGCEFEVVIIAGCNAKNFPNYLSVMSGNEREEKSVFYVAISRAKQKLVLTSPKTCEIDDQYRSVAPCEYVKNIPEQFIEEIIERI